MDSNTFLKWLFTPRDSGAISDPDHTSPSPAQPHPDSTTNAPPSDPKRPAENAAIEGLKRLDLQGYGSVEVVERASIDEAESGKILVSGKQAEEEDVRGRGGGGGGEEELQSENEKGTQYPVRTDAEDCAYYMKRGICKFGSSCKFNHPVGRKAQIARDKENDREAAMGNPGQVECQYYLSPGGCKFGQSCKFSHVAPALEVNFLGLPIRPGEEECIYFMRTGTCKYAANCWFNHPDPTAGGGGGDNPPMEYSSSSRLSPQFPAASAWSSSPGSMNESSPFVPMMDPPTQAVSSPKAEWNGYHFTVNPAPGRSLPPYLPYVMHSASAENHHMYTNHQPQLAIDEYPERPGHPECTYFMKTGDCKFKSNCRFHHSKERISKWSPHVAFSNQSLPPRQDQNICTHYSRYGICRFGASCKFDHPVHVDPSNVSRSRIDQQSSLGGSFPPRTGGAAWASAVPQVIKL